MKEKGLEYFLRVAGQGKGPPGVLAKDLRPGRVSENQGIGREIPSKEQLAKYEKLLRSL